MSLQKVPISSATFPPSMANFEYKNLLFLRGDKDGESLIFKKSEAGSAIRGQHGMKP